MRRERVPSAGATAVAIAVAVAGCGLSGQAPPSRAAPKVFSVRGAVIIDDRSAFTTAGRAEDGDACSGQGAAEGIDHGAEVLVVGSDGTEAGQSELAAGRLNMDYHATAATCSFEIDVGGVRQLGRAEVYTLRLAGHEVSFRQAGANAVYLEVG